MYIFSKDNSVYLFRIFLFCLAGLILISGCYSASTLKKNIPKGKGLIISPAEGNITKIIRNIKINKSSHIELHHLDKNCSFDELAPYAKDGSSLVIISMKLYHKHITLSPIAGKVSRIFYVPGGFRNVFSKGSYEENEHNSIIIDGDVDLAVIQIAGLMARKIVCGVLEGQEISAGDKLGHIKLGSAVALFLPPECKIVVKEGQKVDAAKDIIAQYPVIVNDNK
ncbi:MAG: hypothetical protein C4533_06170 [Candidatus Omnitrophota bacterium]|jgi:phosphatidylserine decarboxylase|nr:MAG: hypothetical protein C4533_06170 [Candidatus Omnitrophota bacterium]